MFGAFEPDQVRTGAVGEHHPILLGDPDGHGCPFEDGAQTQVELLDDGAHAVELGEVAQQSGVVGPGARRLGHLALEDGRFERKLLAVGAQPQHLTALAHRALDLA
ncbi:hypothetical protein D9M68_716850 [compost metagenome]